MKFSIILPVRNGGDYVKECVNSILAQDYPNFNLIILENKSIDGTDKWLEQLNDQRVLIYPANEALTIEGNWGRIKDVAKNEYMTIIGHDDLLAANYLSVMMKLILQYPDASLYQAYFNFIDSKGKEIGKCQPMSEMQQPSEVISNFLCEKMDIMGTGFMMRSSEYDILGGMPSYENLLFADMELWINLSAIRYLAVSKQECFSYRKHAGATTATSTDVKVLKAIDQFISYLVRLKASHPGLKDAIIESADCLLDKYVQGIAHKVMRTASNKRVTPGVRGIIEQFRNYGVRLKGDRSYEPRKNRSVRLAEIIDQNILLRNAFLLFKKIYRKPVL